MALKQQKYLSIGEFSKYAGISRKNLIFYDKIGLFSPELIRENGYRFYSYRQLDTVSVIYSLKKIGMPLKEIKTYLEERSPDRLISLFTIQREKIDIEIKKIKSIKRMMDERIALTQKAHFILLDTIDIRFYEAQPIVTSLQISVPSEEEYGTILSEFYEYLEHYNVCSAYPVNTIVSFAHLNQHETCLFDYYYMNTGIWEDTPRSCYRPAGYYATCFFQGDYMDAEKFDVQYQRLFSFIHTQGYKICGDAYEQSILDEVSIKDGQYYITQLSIAVEQDV